MDSDNNEQLYFKFWTENEQQQDSDNERRFNISQQNSDVLKQQLSEDLSEVETITPDSKTQVSRRIKFF